MALWGLTFLLAWAQGAPEETARRAVEGWLRGELSPRLEEVFRAPPEEASRLLERYALFPPPPRGLSVNLDSPRVEGNRVLFPAAVGEEVGEVVVVLEGGRPSGFTSALRGLPCPATSSPLWRGGGSCS